MENNKIIKITERQLNRIICEMLSSSKKELLQENDVKVPSILYHGSPYFFKKFSMSKINTGQHSQDFGKGLYFTSDKETSIFYANALSNTETLIEKYKSCVKSFTDSSGILEDYLKRGMKMSVKRLVQNYINKNIGNKEEWLNFINEIDKVTRYAYVYTVEISNPKYISRNEYSEIQKKTSFNDDEMNSFLISKGYNGIIYDISMKNTSNKLSKEKNVVIFDENCINIISCKKIYFHGDMKLNI